MPGGVAFVVMPGGVAFVVIPGGVAFLVMPAKAGIHDFSRCDHRSRGRRRSPA